MMQTLLSTKRRYHHTKIERQRESFSVLGRAIQFAQESKNRGKQRALRKAYKMLDLLLAHNVNVNRPLQPGQVFTLPLCFAAYANLSVVTDRLLSCGARANVDSWGNTALIYAVQNACETRIVRALVERAHANILHINHQGFSAFGLACRMGHQEALRIFARYQLQEFLDSATPLQLACAILYWRMHVQIPSGTKKACQPYRTGTPSGLRKLTPNELR